MSQVNMGLEEQIDERRHVTKRGNDVHEVN